MENYNKDYHDGRKACRAKYAKSGLLVLNPNADWNKELTNPCYTCDKYNPMLKIGCLTIRECEKAQRFLLACELKEYFND